jgi:hypothetical protein
MHGDTHHVFAGGVGGFANRFTHFIGFPESDANTSVTVTGNDESAEAEAASTLHNFCASVDKHNLLGGLPSVPLGFVGVL